MNKDFGFGSELLCRGSETHLSILSESIDFCFTSPPYFNTERYSTDLTQSYMKFPIKKDWLRGFLKETFVNCNRVLKRGRLMAINIANVPSYRELVVDTIKVAEEVGFILIDTWGLQLSSLNGGGFKTEPILLFKKSERVKL